MHVIVVGVVGWTISLRRPAALAELIPVRRVSQVAGSSTGRMHGMPLNLRDDALNLPVYNVGLHMCCCCLLSLVCNGKSRYVINMVEGPYFHLSISTPNMLNHHFSP